MRIQCTVKRCKGTFCNWTDISQLRSRNLVTIDGRLVHVDSETAKRLKETVSEPSAVRLPRLVEGIASYNSIDTINVNILQGSKWF